MASAMSPSSTVKASRLPTLASEMKAGLIAEKTTISKTRSTKGPNSGRSIIRPSKLRCM